MKQPAAEKKFGICEYTNKHSHSHTNIHMFDRKMMKNKKKKKEKFNKLSNDYLKNRINACEP